MKGGFNKDEDADFRVNPKVSVIIPTINEAKTIGRVISKIPGPIRKSSEVLVVDTNSTDGTVEAARKAGARVILEPRSGYGRAYLRGLQKVRGELIVMVDGDGTYPIEVLDKMILEMKRKNADMVIGSRFLRGLPKAMTLTHKVGNVLITLATNFLFGTALTDSNSGFRVVRRKALRNLELATAGMEFASELNVKFKKVEYKIVEFPVEYRFRAPNTEAKLWPLRDGWQHFRLLILERLKGIG